MRPLAPEALLGLWEAGLSQHPLDRALTVLAAVFPDQSRPTLARLSIGQRDAHLLALYETMFGPQIAAQARCPACHHALEFTLNAADLHLVPMIDMPDETFTVEHEAYRLTVRLPNSFDLAALLHTSTLDEARHLLIRRCLVQATKDDAPIGALLLPESLTTLLAAGIAAHDPQAEIEFKLDCPVCGHGWPVLFDILSFLWRKIDAQARRLLHEVHSLAYAYGWHEADILGMSAPRRRFYLDMVA